MYLCEHMQNIAQKEREGSEGHANPTNDMVIPSVKWPDI